MKLNRTDTWVIVTVVSIVLVVFFILPQGAKQVPVNKHNEQIVYQSEQDNSASGSMNGNKNAQEDSPKGFSPFSVFFNFLSFALLSVFIVFIVKRLKGDELVFVMVRSKKNKQTKRRYLQVNTFNFSKFSVSLNSPTIAFFHKNQVKKYLITKVENQLLYPLILPANQGHRINIDLDKFYDNVQELNVYKQVQLIYSTPKKSYKSFKVSV